MWSYNEFKKYDTVLSFEQAAVIHWDIPPISIKKRHCVVHSKNGSVCLVVWQGNMGWSWDSRQKDLTESRAQVGISTGDGLHGLQGGWAKAGLICNSACHGWPSLISHARSSWDAQSISWRKGKEAVRICNVNNSLRRVSKGKDFTRYGTLSSSSPWIGWIFGTLVVWKDSTAVQKYCKLTNLTWLKMWHTAESVLQ